MDTQASVLGHLGKTLKISAILMVQLVLAFYSCNEKKSNQGSTNVGQQNQVQIREQSILSKEIESKLATFIKNNPIPSDSQQVYNIGFSLLDKDTLLRIRKSLKPGLFNSPLEYKGGFYFQGMAVLIIDEVSPIGEEWYDQSQLDMAMLDKFEYGDDFKHSDVYISSESKYKIVNGVLKPIE